MRSFAFAVPFAVALVACSSASHDAAADAGDDGAALDAGHDAHTGPIGIPNDSGNPTRFDGGSKCDDLRNQVQAKAAAASACDPQLAQQCGATTPGICCPLTITNGANQQAVDDFGAAVNAFKQAGCTMDCTKFPCAKSPSNTCTGSGHVGTCD